MMTERNSGGSVEEEEDSNGSAVAGEGTETAGDYSRAAAPAGVVVEVAVAEGSNNNNKEDSSATLATQQQFHALLPISPTTRRSTLTSDKKTQQQTRLPPTIDTTKLQGIDSAADSSALMLARAEVANDLLFRDPKRVVIEHGRVQAGEATLRSLVDVATPTIESEAPIESAVATPTPSGIDGESSENSQSNGSNSDPIYPDGDERALPAFILECETTEALDAATGDWEAALGRLGDGDFWRAAIFDPAGLAARAPLHLAAKVRAGVPAPIRGAVWQALTAARSTHLQTVYAQLVREHSPHERIIRRDLPRTFPRVAVFRREGGAGQQRLFRVLKAYSLYDAEVGYCQGLGFVLGPLLLHMPEEAAFCVLVRLMETYGLRGMFTEDMAGLHLRLFQFAALAAELAADVVAHLARLGVAPAMYAPAWFLSLFAYQMPLGFVLRAIDVVVAEGAPESVMRIGIALLLRNRDLILGLDDFESAMAVVNGGLYDDAANARDRPGYVLQDAARLSAVVTRARLDELEAEYNSKNSNSKKMGAAPAAAAAMSPPPTPLTRLLGWPWINSAAKGSASASASDKASTSSSGGGGGANDAALELSDAQRQHSRLLREQMLAELQAQEELAPATALGPVTSPVISSVLNTREIKTRESAESTKTAVDDSDEIDAEPQEPRRMAGAWRDEVLEPLSRQLHDARVTCDSHRDALVALQADHEQLRAELAAAKADRAQLASDNEQLRMLLRRAEAATHAAGDAAEHAGERAKRAEDMLIAARVDLAEADEERALLVRQLSNLRKFIAAESPCEDGAPPLERARLFSVDGGSRPTLIDPRPPAASARFSISSIGSAIRGAIASPRAYQHDAPAPPMSPPPPPLQALSPPPSARQHSSIPLASLHRSKTTPPGTIIAASSRNAISSSSTGSGGSSAL